jgi:hypothetical protein
VIEGDIIIGNFIRLHLFGRRRLSLCNALLLLAFCWLFVRPKSECKFNTDQVIRPERRVLAAIQNTVFGITAYILRPKIKNHLYRMDSASSASVRGHGGSGSGASSSASLNPVDTSWSTNDTSRKSG